MLDTNIFNMVAEGRMFLSSVGGGPFFATHVQLDELKRTANPELRRDLVAHFHEIDPIYLPTETAVWGDSPWGLSKWSSGEFHDRVVERIRELDKKKGASKKRLASLNASRDARILETVAKHRLILVTTDSNLEIVAKEEGCTTSRPVIDTSA